MQFEIPLYCVRTPIQGRYGKPIKPLLVVCSSGNKPREIAETDFHIIFLSFYSNNLQSPARYETHALHTNNLEFSKYAYLPREGTETL